MTVATVAEALDFHKYLSLKTISEPTDNHLVLLLQPARVNQSKVTGADNKFTEYEQIVPIDGLTYKIEFDDYIAYTVLNESFAVHDEYEKFEGGLFRTYSQSHLLDYVKIHLLILSTQDHLSTMDSFA